MGGPYLNIILQPKKWLRVAEITIFCLMLLMSPPISMIQLTAHILKYGTPVQEQTTSEKFPLLSREADNHFPSLGENENVSTLKYVRSVN